MTPVDKTFSIRSIFAWGLLNWLILALGASGFPIWSHHPLPRESVSFFELICGQMVLISLLFPVLTRTPWTLAINLVLIVPIDELGTILSNLNQLQALRCFGCMLIWAIGLAGWRWALGTERQHPMVIAVASCFTLGGAVLDYLRWETIAATGSQNGFRPLSILPNLCLLARTPLPLACCEAGLPALSLLTWLGVRRLFKRRSISLHQTC